MTLCMESLVRAVCSGGWKGTNRETLHKTLYPSVCSHSLCSSLLPLQTYIYILSELKAEACG